MFLYCSTNGEGLTPLDVAVMTNNIPMAKMLLHRGASESPNCKYIYTISSHLFTRVRGPLISTWLVL